MIGLLCGYEIVTGRMGDAGGMKERSVAPSFQAQRLVGQIREFVYSVGVQTNQHFRTEITSNIPRISQLSQPEKRGDCDGGWSETALQFGVGNSNNIVHAVRLPGIAAEPDVLISAAPTPI